MPTWRRSRARLGLNEPMIVQFWLFLTNTLQGDLGQSILMRAPVTEVIAKRLPVTGFLTVYAVALSLLIAGRWPLSRR